MSTWRPDSAMATARFATVVDLPSPATAEVTRITCGPDTKCGPALAPWPFERYGSAAPWSRMAVRNIR